MRTEEDHNPLESEVVDVERRLVSRASELHRGHPERHHHHLHLPRPTLAGAGANRSIFVSPDKNGFVSGAKTDRWGGFRSR